MIWIKKGKLKTALSNLSSILTKFPPHSQILPCFEHNSHCNLKFFLILSIIITALSNSSSFLHNSNWIITIFFILNTTSIKFSNHSSFWTHCIIKFFLIFNTIPTALSWSSSDWTQIALNYLPHSEHNFQCILKSHNSHCIIKFFLHC